MHPRPTLNEAALHSSIQQQSGVRRSDPDKNQSKGAVAAMLYQNAAALFTLHQNRYGELLLTLGDQPLHWKKAAQQYIIVQKHLG